MKQFIPLLLLLPIKVFGQSSPLFEYSYKESVYHFGAVSNHAFDSLTDAEKIRWNLRTTEKTVTKRMDETYHLATDIRYDSISNYPEWMTVPYRVEIRSDQIQSFDKNGNVISSQPTTPEKQQTDQMLSEEWKLHGFHPGLSSFPLFTNADLEQLNEQGLTATRHPDGVVELQNADIHELIDFKNKFIQNIYVNSNGQSITVSRYYEAWGNNGFVLKIEKTEKTVNSEKGPCVRETDLHYFKDYTIVDNANLMTRDGNSEEKMELFPNPTDGHMQVYIKLAPENHAEQILIIHPITGQVEKTIPIADNDMILLDVSDVSNGQHLLRLINTSSTKNAFFIKQ